MRKRDKRRLTPSERLTAKRKREMQKALANILQGLVGIMRQHANGHAINAAVPEMVYSNGVRGDAAFYAPIVVLTYDHFPGYTHLARISNAITNELPISRVTYNATSRVVCIGDVQFLVPTKP